MGEIYNNGNPQIQIVVIGNKNDLEKDRKVTYEEGEAFAQKNGLSFFETSAKSQEQVNYAFFGLSNSILDKIQQGKIDQNTVGIKYSASEELRIKSLAKKQKKMCCWA